MAKVRQSRGFGFLLKNIVLLGLLLVVWWVFGRVCLITVAIVLVTLRVLGVVFIKNPTKTLVNIGQANWYSLLEALLHRGADRASLMIEVIDADRLTKLKDRVSIIEAPSKTNFLQFKKYDTTKGSTLQLHFPRAPWSQAYYVQVQELLKQRGASYVIRPWRLKIMNRYKIDETIAVYLEQDLEQAVSLAKIILFEVFKLTPRDNALFWFHRVPPADSSEGV